MTAPEIIQEIEATGGVLILRGDRIVYDVPKAARALVEILRERKPEILRLLRERKRRMDLAHLRPFLGKRVWTPFGPGTLVAVGDYVSVELEEDGGRMRWYDSTAVLP